MVGLLSSLQCEDSVGQDDAVLTQLFAFAGKKGTEHIGCEMAGVGCLHTGCLKDTVSNFLLMRMHDVARYWKQVLGKSPPTLVHLREWLSAAR